MAVIASRNVSADGSSMQSDGSCSSRRTMPRQLEAFLPKFVKEARRLQSIEMSRYGFSRTVEFTIRFTARTDQAQRDFERLQKSNRDQPAADPTRKNVQCDGPCKKKVFPEDVTQFGDCDHNICSHCLEVSNTSKMLYDGSPCCPNSACARRRESNPTSRSGSRRTTTTTRKSISSSAESNKHRKKTKKTKKIKTTSTNSDVSTDSRSTPKNLAIARVKSSPLPKPRKEKKKKNSSPSSNTSKKRMKSQPKTLCKAPACCHLLFAVNLYVFWVDKARKKVKRDSVEMELLDDMRLARVMDRVGKYIPSEADLDHIKWYYTTKEEFGPSDLVLMDSQRLAEKTVAQLVGCQETLTIVAVAPEIAI